MALATLTIDLEAKLAKLQQGMDRAVHLAERDAQRIGRAFSGLASLAGGIGAALGAAFSVQQVTGWVKGSIDAADAAAKQARSVGLLTSELTGLQHAADLSGVSADEFVAGLAKLARTVGDANDGSKEAINTFGKLGIQFKNADGTLKSTNDLLEDIADRFQSMPDGINKTALAQELFGRSGAKMISLLNSGSAGLQEFRREAEALGLVIDQDMAEAAERLNDNIARLQKNFDGLVNAITARMLPALNEFIARVSAAVKEFDGIGQAIRLSFGSQQFADTTQGVEFYTSKVQQLRAELDKLRAGGGIFNAIRADGKAKELADAQKLLDFYQRAASISGTVGAGGGRGFINPPGVGSGVGGAAAAAGRAPRGRAAAPDIPFAITDAFAEQKAAFLRLERDAYADIDRALRDAQDRAREAAYAILDPLADAKSRFLQAEKEGYEDTERLLEQMKDRVAEVDDGARELGLTFSSAFEDAIVNGSKLRDVIDGLAKDLLRLGTRKLVTEPLTDFFAQWFKSFGAAQPGPGGGGLFGNVLGSLFSGFFADGGFIPPGRWGLAGERGPEPVFGGRTGMTVQAAGGMTVHLNQVFHGPVDRRTGLQAGSDAVRAIEHARLRGNWR